MNISRIPHVGKIPSSTQSPSIESPQRAYTTMLEAIAQTTRPISISHPTRLRVLR